YDGSAIVQGLGMVNYATLTQMIAEGGKVCFYAITCEGDQLCKRMYCIPAEEILHILQEMGIEPRQSSDTTTDNDGNGTKQSKSQELGNDTTPQLMPNPTTGEVNVIGISDEVVEVLVMDMNGRKMATFENTANFNISTLPSGIYIVRVKTNHDNETHNASPRTPQELVTYLKLVKK
nr:T9SS type A sorting domain-containing protein [Bacteroidales bacterium]